VITLTRSKTDQVGEGRKIGIPFGRGRICPVQSLKSWIDLLDGEEGALFRPINKGGTISNARLSASAVAELVKYYAAQIGLDPKNYSGHSLRSGLATSAAQHGASSWQIRKQTGHSSDAMLARYIRDGDIFRDNAAGILF
jgi:integrase